ALAHAGDDNAAGTLCEDIDRLHESAAKSQGEGADPVGLDLEHAAGNCQIVMRLDLAGAPGCAGLDDCRHRLCSLSTFTHANARVRPCRPPLEDRGPRPTDPRRNPTIK